MHSIGRKVFLFFCAAFAFVILWLAIIAAWVGFDYFFSKNEIKGKIPADFPIVVVIDTNAQVVDYAKLKSLRKTHPTLRLQLPSNWVSPTSTYKQQTKSNNQFTSFNVTARADHSQSIQSFISNAKSFANIGWYRVHDQEIIPEYQQTFIGIKGLSISAEILGLLMILGGLSLVIKQKILGIKKVRYKT